MGEAKLLSLIIPAYKQEKTIKKDITNLSKALEKTGTPFEVIIVVDGEKDRTYKVAKTLASRKIKVLSYENNMGKGYAVRIGAKEAKGDVVGFIDAGMDIDPAGIEMLLNHMRWYDADVIVGSKLHPVSRVKYPFKRKVLSWGYRTLTRFLFGFKVRDTQVGLKFFKKRVVKKVFPKLLVNDFAFDVEVLAVSYAMGFTRIYEAPIKLEFNKRSTMASKKFVKVILGMLYDTLLTYYKLKIARVYKLN